jgi:5'-3' exonuclease
MLNLIDGDPFLSAACWGRTFEAAKKHIKTQIDWVVEDNFSTDYLIATGDPGKSNFRDLLHPGYKKSNSRDKSRKDRPEWYEKLRDYLLAQDNVVVSYGCEADDLIRMWARQAEDAGDPFIVSSIDKDLDCIPGMHYNPRSRETYEVTADYANAFYWQQILQGDGVDNIPGIPGIGPTKAKQMLLGATSHAARKKVVIKAYYEAFGEHWKPWLLANARLIHMWQSEHDYFNIEA